MKARKSNEATVGSGYRLEKSRPFRFMVEDRDEGGAVDNDHRGKPKSS
jgi:hypothetical protein